jgi:hypothetical protein
MNLEFENRLASSGEIMAGYRHQKSKPITATD